MENPFLKNSFSWRAFEHASVKRNLCHFDLLARKRFLAELCQNDFAYSYDVDKAERVCRFAELLPYPRGRWASTKKKFKLEPWQIFILCNIFGWVNDRGVRRFNEAFIFLPRKNGKSVFAAIICLYMLFADEEYGAEVFCGASTEDQALMVFNAARQICLKTPDLVRRFEAEVFKRSITVSDTGALMAPVVGKPGDGASPHCWIVDEYHEHLDDSQYETARTGMGARQQPLLVVTTTAGKDLSSACYRYQQDAEAALQGVRTHDRWFISMFGLRPDDDWEDFNQIKKVNPNLGVSVDEERLRFEHKMACSRPALQNSFRIKHANQWVASKASWITTRAWSVCKSPIEERDVKYQQAIGAIDLSSRLDFTAFIKLYVNLEDGVRKYHVFPKFYLPQETIEDALLGAYGQWATEGLITVCPGAEINYSYVEKDILAWRQQHEVRELCYDPYKAGDLISSLDAQGVFTVEFPQRVATMSPAMKELEAAIAARRIKHDGNAVLTWMASNVVNKPNVKDNHYPDKAKAINKIDGMVALIMAVGRAMVDLESGDAGPSIYETRGVLGV